MYPVCDTGCGLQTVKDACWTFVSWPTVEDITVATAPAVAVIATTAIIDMAAVVTEAAAFAKVAAKAVAGAIDGKFSSRTIWV